MTAYERILAMEANRNQRLKSIAKSLGREKTQDILVEAQIAIAELQNAQADRELEWRYI